MRLEALALEKRDMDVRDAFAQDASRVETLSWDLDGLHVDASKQRWDAEVKDALIALGEERLSGAIADLFGGVKLNTTEGRPCFTWPCAEKMAMVLRWMDRTSCPRFSRSAGACLTSWTRCTLCMPRAR